MDAAQSGRIIIVVDPLRSSEPRLRAGSTERSAPYLIGMDVNGLQSGRTTVVDDKAAVFPFKSLSELPSGNYTVQAVFDTNIDLKSINAPGNLVSSSLWIRIDRSARELVRIELNRRLPPEELPQETEYLKFVKIQSKLLSHFHGRPIFLRAGIILPMGFDREPQRKYPLRVSVGGYGERFTTIQRKMASGADFRAAWTQPNAPRMILLQLDGDGPFGDCYQVNSANNGPYGDAVTTELIPYVEQKYRAIGRPYARVIEGGSTGGWVALALQIFYPDLFNGAWAGYPDAADFRALQLIISIQTRMHMSMIAELSVRVRVI